MRFTPMLRGAAAVACCWSVLAVGAACGSFGGVDPPLVDAGPAGETGADVGLTDAPPVCDSGGLATDKANCGRCGHSCLGGTCAEGSCQPFVIAKGGALPVVDLVVDATRVLWATSDTAWNGFGGLFSCPRSGCVGPPTALLATPQEIGTLTGDGAEAYVSFLFSSKGIAKIDAAVARIAKLATHTSAVRLQRRGSKLYYLAQYEPADTTTTVFEWDGTSETAIAAIQGKNIYDLVVTGTHVFVSDTFTIYTCEIGACASLRDFTTNSAGVSTLTTDGSRLFWGVPTAHAVLSCPVSGSCSPEPVLHQEDLGKNDVRTVTYDHGTVYVSTSANEIFACDPKVGCTPGAKPLVRAGQLFDGLEYRYGHALAADDTAVYWAETDGAGDASSGHRIMKLAK